MNEIFEKILGLAKKYPIFPSFFQFATTNQSGCAINRLVENVAAEEQPEWESGRWRGIGAFEERGGNGKLGDY